MNRELRAVLLLGGLVALAACNRPESAADVTADVAEAQEEGAQEIAAAKKSARETYAKSAQKLSEGRAPALKAEARAAYEVEIAEIESAQRVARERCDGSSAPQEKNDCLDRAHAEYDSRMSAAKARRDGMQQDAEALEEAEPRVGTGNLLAA